MDPASVAGLAGATLGIIDVIGRSIRTLHDTHRKMKEADSILNALIAELLATRVALNQVRRWIDGNLRSDESHYQLIMDLEATLTNCRLIVESIDFQMDRLVGGSANEMNFETRLRTLYSERDTRDHFDRLSRVVNALNLLISAFNTTASNQAELLSDSSNRKTLDQMRDDSSSLIALYDKSSSTSMHTGTTTATSKLSLRFDFDTELLSYRPYQNAFRALMRREKTISGKPSTSAVNHSTITDNSTKSILRITTDAIQTITKPAAFSFCQQHCCARNILLAGDKIGALRTIRALKPELFNNISNVQRLEYRAEVLKKTAEITLQILSASKFAVEHADIGHPMDQYIVEDLPPAFASCLKHQQKSIAEVLEVHIAIRVIEMAFPAMSDSIIRGTANVDGNFNRVARALGLIWDVISESMGYSCSFNDIVTRLSQPDYVPTDFEIFRLGLLDETPGIDTSGHVRFPNVQLKWIQSADCEAKTQQSRKNYVVFFVDLLSYNKVTMGSTETTVLENQIRQFESIINSDLFRGDFSDPLVLLILSNHRRLEEELKRDPLNKYYPEYTGDRYVQAVEHIISRFNRVNRLHVDFRRYLGEIETFEDLASALEWAPLEVNMENTYHLSE